MTDSQLAADPRFWRGVDAFDSGDYFAAHEEWESIWLAAEGEQKVFLAGLIQAAAGLLKQGQGRRVGARRLLLRARGGLAAGSAAGPVDVGALIARLDAALEQLDRDEPDGTRELPAHAPLVLAPGWVRK